MDIRTQKLLPHGVRHGKAWQDQVGWVWAWLGKAGFGLAGLGKVR